ncbi:MAG: hypothetical protein DYG92_09740 [Leptolyngbya sp. PLA1]|nr:hypothetical protein [Leptolyngbya sp. PLA1]
MPGQVRGPAQVRHRQIQFAARDVPVPPVTEEAVALRIPPKPLGEDVDGLAEPTNIPEAPPQPDPGCFVVRLGREHPTGLADRLKPFA